MIRKGLWIFTMMFLLIGCSSAWMEGEQQEEAAPVQTSPDNTDSSNVRPTPDRDPVTLEFPEAEYTVQPGEKSKIEVLPSLLDGALTWSVEPNDYIQVMSDGTIVVSEDAPIGKAVQLEAAWQDQTATTFIRVWVSADETIQVSGDEHLPVVTNENSIAVMVNKQRALPDDFVPQNLTVPDVPFSFSGEHEKQLLQEEAAHALEQLFKAAHEAGIELYAVSGYRSYERQRVIFQYNIANQGEEHARQFSAEPGTSEHQTGLAMDVSSRTVGYRLTQQFGETDEGKWLADHAHDYGFIIRYPKGKESITGYAYEPWHLRYVGIPLAQDMKQRELTMEEYFSNDLAVPVLAQN